MRGYQFYLRAQWLMPERGHASAIHMKESGSRSRGVIEPWQEPFHIAPGPSTRPTGHEDHLKWGALQEPHHTADFSPFCQAPLIPTPQPCPGPGGTFLFVKVDAVVHATHVAIAPKMHPVLSNAISYSVTAISLSTFGKLLGIRNMFSGSISIPL